jgi:hypothetical protein
MKSTLWQTKYRGNLILQAFRSWTSMPNRRQNRMECINVFHGTTSR